jgi:hypothetical protein
MYIGLGLDVALRLWPRHGRAVSISWRREVCDKRDSRKKPPRRGAFHFLVRHSCPGDENEGLDGVDLTIPQVAFPINFHVYNE